MAIISLHRSCGIEEVSIRHVSGPGETWREYFGHYWPEVYVALKDLISSIEIRSEFIRPICLSFDIVLRDDIIKISFRFLPAKNELWCGYYQSCKYGSGMFPIQNVTGREKATPMAIAEALCTELGAGKPRTVRNICRNYVDLHIPNFIKLSQVKPNYPKQPTKIERIIGYVLFADLRGFSTWSLTTEPEQISELYQVISDRAAQMLIDYPFDYWKLLGDGIMLVWQLGDNESNTADCTIRAAYELHNKYWYYRREAPYGVPKGFGIAICAGSLIKFSSATFLEQCVVNDYLGPIVNQAARLQALAKPGQILVNKRVAKMSKDFRYTLKDVTDALEIKMENLKGLPQSERKVFKLKHEYYDSK